MDISSATRAETPVTNNTTSTTSNAVLSSDFELFLQMLTAQAEYQDPLEPNRLLGIRRAAGPVFHGGAAGCDE